MQTEVNFKNLQYLEVLAEMHVPVLFALVCSIITQLFSACGVRCHIKIYKLLVMVALSFDVS